ncbi:MAG: helix-turn-helix domain-containing protein [Bacteroidales bacterium]|nr:helix-turn-helix domain-containing protein [Bacteroidales bacterium]
MNRSLILIISLLPSFILGLGQDNSIEKSLKLGSPQQIFDQAQRYMAEEDYVEALRLYIVCQALATNPEEEYLRYCSRGSIGNIFYTFEDYAEAAYYYEQAIALAIEAGDDKIASNIAANLMQVHNEIGNIQSSKRWAQYLLEHPIEDGEQEFFSTLANLLVADGEGHSQEALQLAQRLKYVADSLALPQYASTPYGYMAHEWSKLGQRDSALECARIFLEEAERVSNLSQQLMAHKLLADLTKQMGDTAMARRYGREYQQFNETTFHGPEYQLAKMAMLDLQDQAFQALAQQMVARIERQNWIIIGVVAFCLLLLAGIIVFIILNRRLRFQLGVLYRKNEEQFEQDKHLEALAQQVEEPAIAGERTQGSRPHLLSKIIEAINDPQALSNPDFDLDALARMVSTNTHYVSEALNTGLGKNFKSYLNECRIRVACERLKNPAEGESLQSISEEVGFNSMPTFFRAFKRTVGMTPAAYRSLSK